MSVQSKLIDIANTCSCRDYIHPWTASCACGSAGMLLAGLRGSFRTYSTVYLLALLLRMRIPRVKDLQNTLTGILQSTVFLAMNGSIFGLLVCWIRLALGRYYLSTVAFWPTFISSMLALNIERPERRPALALYVANVGLETLWNMLEVRGLVRSIPNGQVLIMGVSVTALLYLYRAGLHKTVAKDATFKAIQLLVGKEEEGRLKTPAVTTTQSSRSRPFNFQSISAYVQLYDRLRTSKHPSCPHREGCAPYALLGGAKLFLGGVGVQVGLRLLLSIGKIIKMKMEWRKQIFNKNSLQLGLALGTFSLIYKAVSCSLRHGCGYDSATFAIPAGLLGSIGLLRFPNTTIALYAMWKALQLFYTWGIEEGVLPEVPHFVFIMYSFFTAILFHANIMEAQTVRPSYYNFLMNISGNRISRFDTQAFEGYGLNSYHQVCEVVKKLKIDMTSPYPSFALAV
ncbi:transmembrane protein 135-like [Drosophila tropicalis]|uniref:transmembrane protein 135-like n=1 Tax=Drosophila tropicalis TaxID=46794 RepID=UPI0035ABECE9